jgi:hypothetical protein
MKNTPVKVAVTGPSWTPIALVVPRLERELRVHPGLTLVTQEHFLKKVDTWAKSRGVLVECVQGRTKYNANEALVHSGAMEYLVFAKDRFTDHLLTCLRQAGQRLVRHYGT